jgi:hypothetical protein
MNQLIPTTMGIMQSRKLDEPMMEHKKFVKALSKRQAIYHQKINELHAVVECEILFCAFNE